MTAADLAHREFAPAKVNLYLHLRGRRADGYHLLDSLAVFPAVGDWVSVAQRSRLGLSLEICGPFGGALSTGLDNLVLRAARALAATHGLTPNAAIRLEKNLPIASGIGGGSSDAAATLRHLSGLWDVAIPDGLAQSLGADVPVCLSAPQPRLMAGIGEQLNPPPPMPGFWMILVNPGVAVATGAVFAALDQHENTPGLSVPPAGLSDFPALIDWLSRQRNDLQAAAVSICPAIAEVLAALDDAPVARMSGSGATCFALHANEASAVAQSERLRRARPDWWISVAPVAVTPAR
jgi:4-diphosphocytidyl-2-C-methyl-D-erythritol kinase